MRICSACNDPPAARTGCAMTATAARTRPLRTGPAGPHRAARTNS
ncbi:hypothetical protein [Lysobacter gummosus]